jgi:enamine deaminase RidA (YjgF/YER057c/UK114 family)
MVKRIIPASMQSSYDNFHFAPAVLDGELLRCSGIIGVDRETMKVAADPETQFAQAFDNLGEVLKEAGGNYSDVIEMTTFHVGLNEHLNVFLEVKDRYIQEPYPAWTAIGITELAYPDGLVEIRVNAKIQLK